MVKETLTSELASISTAVSARLKTLEDALEKSMRHEHARGADIHDEDPLLAGDGLDHVGARHRLGDDARARESGRREFSTTIGIFFSTAGSSVEG